MKTSFTATATSTYPVLEGYNGDVGAFGLFMVLPELRATDRHFRDYGGCPSISLLDPGNAGASFTVEYGLAGFVPGTGTLVTGQIGIDGPPVTLPGLDPATDYDVYLTEDCGGGDLSYTRGPVGFHNAHGPGRVERVLRRCAADLLRTGCDRQHHREHFHSRSYMRFCLHRGNRAMVHVHRRWK
ncbi:MAG: hypothetical protein IPO90_14815 [Flavobacteriales bacterium]|nr:hypothetical protein [Flavobacteriales bacterium]